MDQLGQPPYRQLVLDPEADPLRGSWAALLALGIAMAVLGIFAFCASFTTTMISMLILGFVVLGAAAVQLTYALMGKSWRGFALHLALAALYLIGGLTFLTQMTMAAESLTMFLGAFLMVSGVFRIVGSFSYRFSAWGWALVGGLVSLMLGGLILAAWPATSLFVIGLMVGVDLFFLGSYLSIYALSIHREQSPVHPKLNTPVYS